MPTYSFQGRNSEGGLISGKRLSQSVDNLSDQLMKEGVVPIKIDLVETKENAWVELRRLLFRKKVSTDDLANFCRQMHTLTKAGVSLTLSIKQLAESARNPIMGDALFGLVDNLEAGQDLSSSMQRFPDVFTPLIVSMVKVGQNSGKLDEMFFKLYQFLEMESASLKRTKAILRYPIFVVISIVTALIIVNAFVIPTFAKVYEKTNLKLPYLTEVLINFSAFFIHYWLLFLVFFISLGASWLYYIKTPAGNLFWHKFQLRIPVVGKILKQIILLRFSQAFAIVVNSGIPLVDGIALVAQSVQNSYIRSRVMVMHTEIQRGKTLTQAAAAANIFSSLEIQMLSISEETGSLETMLEQIAGFYEREVDYDLKKLGDIIEPTLIIGLSILVLGLALAVYLPIWNMIKIAHQ